MSEKIHNYKYLMETNYYSMYQTLIDYIKENNVQIGDKLPNETELAEKTFTNRSTLRETLRVMEAFGIIESRKKSGNIYVCDAEIGLMNLFMITNALESSTMIELNKLRALIETRAVDNFIRKASDYDIFLLEMICKEQMNSVEDKSSNEYLEYHIMFHDQIMKFTDNKLAKLFVHAGIRLVNTERMKRFKAEKTNPVVADYIDKARMFSHDAIVKAVKERDIMMARAIITQHIFMTGEAPEEDQLSDYSY